MSEIMLLFRLFSIGVVSNYLLTFAHYFFTIFFLSDLFQHISTFLFRENGTAKLIRVSTMEISQNHGLK